MLRLLVLAIVWLIALPFTLLRWAIGRLVARRVVLELHLEGRHPLHAPPVALLQRPRRLGISRRALAVRLREAVADPRVVALSVRVGPLHGGWGELHDLRAALERFRAAGKPVTAFVAHPDTRTLWVASAADEVLLPPHVPVDALGLAAEMTFLGEGLDRAGVGFEVLTAGAYKSAMEPLTRREPSPAAREAIDALLDDLEAQVVGALADRTGRAPEAVRAALAAAPLPPDEAVAAGLADAIIEDENVRERLDCHDKGKRTAVDLRRYGGRPRPWPRLRWRRPRLARIDIHGVIREGREDQPEPVGASAATVVRALDRARRDKRLAGVLLYVDSRGGSATASERMWRAVRRLAETKPVVAVMGDAAASGGYYVASAAHTILAAPGTLTGSIGVIAAKPVIGGLLERLGLHQVRFERGPRSTMYSPGRPFTPDERAALEATLRRMYELFLSRVAEGRGRTPESIAPVAEGRVWTGRQALAHGLVDGLGDERAAIALLAERAGVAEPRALLTFEGRRPLLARLARPMSFDVGDWWVLAALARHERALAWCPVELR